MTGRSKQGEEMEVALAEAAEAAEAGAEYSLKMLTVPFLAAAGMFLPAQ